MVQNRAKHVILERFQTVPKFQKPFQIVKTGRVQNRSKCLHIGTVFKAIPKPFQIFILERFSKYSNAIKNGFELSLILLLFF